MVELIVNFLQAPSHCHKQRSTTFIWLQKGMLKKWSSSQAWSLATTIKGMFSAPLVLSFDHRGLPSQVCLFVCYQHEKVVEQTSELLWFKTPWRSCDVTVMEISDGFPDFSLSQSRTDVTTPNTLIQHANGWLPQSCVDANKSKGHVYILIKLRSRLGSKRPHVGNHNYATNHRYCWIFKKNFC